MKREYKDIIFTNHALQRLRRRRISQAMAAQALQKPDERQSEAAGKIRFEKSIQSRKVQVVARYLEDEKQWLVLTAWVRGEDDPRPWWLHVLLLPYYVLWGGWRGVRWLIAKRQKK